jgi:transcriptional antiterminator
MIDLHEIGKKITIGRIASLLNCSARTIHRNMSYELKKEKELLNKENEKI